MAAPLFIRYGFRQITRERVVLTIAIWFLWTLGTLLFFSWVTLEGTQKHIPQRRACDLPLAHQRSATGMYFCVCGWPADSFSSILIAQLNGTACAIPRTIIALLETHQDANGNFAVPTALQRYLPPGV